MTKSLDHLLRGTLRERTSGSPSGPCLDAETVAGWFDDTLDARDRAAAEAHAADCARCQALLAAMVRTAPPAATHPWRRASFMGWLVPLTVAATALLIWVNLPQRPVVSPSPATTPVEVKPAYREQARTGTNPTVDATVPPAAGRDRSTSRPKAEQRQLRKDAVRSGGDNAVRDNSIARAAPEPPPQAAPESSAASAPSRGTIEETITVGAPQPASARMRRELREAPIVSSDWFTRWRIATEGTVQRSTDGGVTWETQATGAAVTLTAGVSPAPSVCWLVGPGGVVLVTTDGRSWERLSFPEVVDLVAIRATDDKTATVTAADGRRFTTTNRGQTWER
jgi:hypothetical protein